MSRTLIQIFLDTVDTLHKDAQFLRKVKGSWQPVSAASALESVECLALGLEWLGVRSGDRVAILSETRLEWGLADLAVLGLGAVTVPVYPTLTAPQCAALLRDSEARVVFVANAKQRDKLRSLRSSLPRLEFIIEIDSSPTPSALGELPWADLLSRGAEHRAREPQAFRTRAAAVRAEDLATIIYTSGTTGEPKGAMLSHANVASNVDSCLEVIQLGPSDVSLSFLPLSHIFERMGGLYAMLAAGVTIAYAENMDSVGLNSAEVRPTVINGVPRFYEKVHAKIMDSVAKRPALMQRLFSWGLAQGVERARLHFSGLRPAGFGALRVAIADRLVMSKIRERMGGRLRVCISGGAPLSPHTLEFFFAIGIPILEGYGLTETSPVICLNRLGRERPGAVGPPIPGVEVRIGDDGEILTRGPHVMLGYYKNPEATRIVCRDGWFHTGDIGRLDADGGLVITDRLKDLLVTAGGKKVAPQPIEAKLKQSDLIAEAVLLGDRQPFVVCLLVPDFARLHAEAKTRGWLTGNASTLLARPEVRALYAAEVERANVGRASFEQIKKFDLLDHELTQETGELTPSLKVKRSVIVARHAARIAAMYGGAMPEPLPTAHAGLRG